jgi:hypothetical protein
VVDAGSALLEERCNQHDSVLFRGRGKFARRRTRNRFGEIEERMIFALAEILCLEKFREADDLGAASSRVGNAFQSFRKILVGIRAAGHLYQGYAEFVRGHAISSLPINIAFASGRSAEHDDGIL